MNTLLYDFEIYKSPEIKIPEHFLSGDHAQKLLVIIKAEDQKEANMQLLRKILQAVNKDLSHDALFLQLPPDQMLGINTLLNNGIHRIIMFGINPKALGLSFETILYKDFKIQDKRFLMGHSLSQINENQEFKKALWNALKSLFDLQ